MHEKPSATLPGTVNKVIPPISPYEAGTVQISIRPVSIAGTARV